MQLCLIKLLRSKFELKGPNHVCFFRITLIHQNFLNVSVVLQCQNHQLFKCRMNKQTNPINFSLLWFYSSFYVPYLFKFFLAYYILKYFSTQHTLNWINLSQRTQNCKEHFILLSKPGLFGKKITILNFFSDQEGYDCDWREPDRVNKVGISSNSIVSSPKLFA